MESLMKQTKEETISQLAARAHTHTHTHTLSPTHTHTHSLTYAHVNTTHRYAAHTCIGLTVRSFTQMWLRTMQYTFVVR